MKEFWGMKYNRLGVLRLQNQTCQWELNSRDYSIVDKIVKSHDVNFQIKYSRFEAAFSSSSQFNDLLEKLSDIFRMKRYGFWTWPERTHCYLARNWADWWRIKTYFSREKTQILKNHFGHPISKFRQWIEELQQLFMVFTCSFLHKYDSYCMANQYKHSCIFVIIGDLFIFLEGWI